jgi:hypothetical protein
MAKEKYLCSWRIADLFSKWRRLNIFSTFFVTMAKVLAFLNWRMLGPHGVCVDRLQKAKYQSYKVIFACSFTRFRAKIFFVRTAQVKPEQQQRNLNSFAQVWP